MSKYRRRGMITKPTGKWLARFALASVCALAVVLFLLSWGRKTHAQTHIPVQMTTDWSNRHMVYSAPSSIVHAWRLQAEPRYLHQLTRRSAPAMQTESALLMSDQAQVEAVDPERHEEELVRAASEENDDDEHEHEHENAPTASVHGAGDWGMSLLAGGSVGIGQFPAKFNFDVTATPDCTKDFIVYNTSLAGIAPSAAATRTGTFTGVASSGTVTITTSEGTLVLTASTTTNTGTNFQVITSVTVEAANLAAAINRNNFATLGSGNVKVKASSSAGVVTVTASKDGAAALDGIEGNSTTLAQTINGGNFAWAGATLTGGVGTGNIVAFNNLYSTQGAAGGLCNQNGPLVYWSYFTGTGTAVTSVVLSGDGTKVAFVEDVASAATLRILKWKAGEGAGTGYPSAVDQTLAAGADWSTCTAGNSCIASIAFNGAPNDTRSAPFYDYNTDTLYVGDNSGHMHKFVGVFLKAPTECIAGVMTVCGTAAQAAAWPLAVNAGAILTSPVYDGVSGNIFVGDSTGRLSFIREVGSTVGTCSPQPCLDATNQHVGPAGSGGAIVDSPIVDGSTGMVFAVNGTETSANRGTILQANTALASPVSFRVGGTGAGSVLYSGAFDNTYLTSAKPNIAGHMYVCGKASNHRDRPYIYQLSFAAATGVLTGVGTSAFPAGNGYASASGEACSPVTEFYNSGAATDRIFFSIGNRANNAATNNPIPAGACRTNNAGCVLSIKVTGNPSWPPTLPSALFVSAPTPANTNGSTSGIVVDNNSASAQASSFYFSLGTNSTGTGPGVPSCNTTAGVGCAVKLTQSALN